MDCPEAARLIQLRLDHEIDSDERLELELHLTECPPCKGRQDQARWVHSNVRQKLCESIESEESVPPAELRDRVLRDIRGEAKTARPVWPTAAAATVVVFAVGGLFSFSARSESDPMIEESIARHSSNLPPEVRASSLDEKGVDRFLRRNLRYPVEVVRFSGDRPVKLVGARLANIKDRDVAYLMYDHRGAKLSLFAYPGNVPSATPGDFEERRAGRRVVRVGRRRGYNVVSWTDEGRDLSYSLVSDVDSNELVRLASDAR